MIVGMDNIGFDSFEPKKIKIPIRAALLERGNISPEDDARIDKIIENGEKEKYTKELLPTSINEKPKYSEGYIMCTGMIAVGRSKNNNKEISFLTHDYLPSIKDTSDEKWWDQYDKHLKRHRMNLQKLLEDFKEQVDGASIDVIILGGEAWGKKSPLFSNWKGYENAINYSTSLVKEILKITPTVITGPKAIGGAADAYFDTENRRLYLVRPNQENSKRNEAYSPDEFHKQEKEW